MRGLADIRETGAWVQISPAKPLKWEYAECLRVSSRRSDWNSMSRVQVTGTVMTSASGPSEVSCPAGASGGLPLSDEALEIIPG